MITSRSLTCRHDGNVNCSQSGSQSGSQSVTSRSRIWVSPVVCRTLLRKKEQTYNIVPDMHDEIEICPIM